MSFDERSLFALFQQEAKAQSAKLASGLIALEVDNSPKALEELMRAAHSLKGAARIVGHEGVASIAHELEECFVAAQAGLLSITANQIDVLLGAVDLLAVTALSDPEDAQQPSAVSAREEVLHALRAIAVARDEPATRVMSIGPEKAQPARSMRAGEVADDTDRLLTLASEALVATRALAASVSDDGRDRWADQEIARAFDALGALLVDSRQTAVTTALSALRTAVDSLLARRRDGAFALDSVSQRVSSSVSQLYEGVLDARMLPFGDGIVGLPRLVRDTARELGRQVDLVTAGENTPVDREVLRRLDAPLGHLIRNAVDHGIEPPAERVALGKNPRGTIRVEARHGGGRLLVSVQDDGRGLDVEAVRARVIARGLADAQVVAEMSSAELSHFLFLPGFTMRDAVTSISGRGVGLDVVQMSVREIGGDVRLVHLPTGGMRFDMQLPLTLSVIRALVVLIGDEPYAFPLARVHRILRVQRSEVSSVEGRQHFALDGRQIGLVWAHQLLDVPSSQSVDDMSVVVIGEHELAWGVVVDRFIGEQELVLRGLDARLSKVQDVGGAALLADGSPLLVLDVEDLMRTASALVATGSPEAMRQEPSTTGKSRKRVLVVDDSLTVRELERKMIEGLGYIVDVAVDGMEGWNAMRAGHYDLVVTDVDMPRMDGIELVTLIKRDAALRATPVMIVSYKDRDEDRRRGLDAGADYYLTKGSFYDETMLRAVEDFIGGDS
ncbi:MAG TPA: hybrid sensor histidine kinase/response regulator [Gemmatimonadaceae bacterium]|nr:hybrid sensor histidine kinase/response regulator [Gemmatimonadaceae bacterium]